jgi:hypothetical protein
MRAEFVFLVGLCVYACVCVHAFIGGRRSALVRRSAVLLHTEGKTFAALYPDKLPGWLLGRCAELGFVSPTRTQIVALEVRCNDAGDHRRRMSAMRTAYSGW